MAECIVAGRGGGAKILYGQVAASTNLGGTPKFLLFGFDSPPVWSDGHRFGSMKSGLTVGSTMQVSDGGTKYTMTITSTGFTSDCTNGTLYYLAIM